MIEFVDDEDGYLAWIADHPDGFVVNCERIVRPTYLVLHRATCGHVSSPKHTNYTTRDYIKICGDDVESLESWAAYEAGGALSPCKVCGPEGRILAPSSGQENLGQRITANDIRHGIVRIPGPAKALFPSHQGEIEVSLRGVRTAARWDPRLGPDRARSGVLRVGKGLLAQQVSEGERLQVRADEGLIHLE